MEITIKINERFAFEISNRLKSNGIEVSSISQEEEVVSFVVDTDLSESELRQVVGAVPSLHV